MNDKNHSAEGAQEEQNTGLEWPPHKEEHLRKLCGNMATLQRKVNLICEALENPETLGENQTPHDYLDGVLEVEYITDIYRNYLGARVLVSSGVAGLDIWINTRANAIEGYYQEQTCLKRYCDELELDEALKARWECNA